MVPKVSVHSVPRLASAAHAAARLTAASDVTLVTLVPLLHPSQPQQLHVVHPNPPLHVATVLLTVWGRDCRHVRMLRLAVQPLGVVGLMLFKPSARSCWRQHASVASTTG